MSGRMEYIRNTYKVPAKRGAKIRYTGNTEPMEGTIVCAKGGYLRARFTFGLILTLHPTWEIEYLDYKEKTGE